jgi:CTP synthase (UTP-ammonia lyase)
VLKIADADTAEHGSNSSNIIISPVACALPNRAAGAPKLSGENQISLTPGTLLERIYGADDATEEYFCNYEVNRAYEQHFREAGLIVSARGPTGEVRAIELADHPFFIATLFQPQLSSKAAEHPVIEAFLRAAA